MLPPRIGALGLLRMEIGSLVMLLTAPCLGAASPAAASIIEGNGPHSIVIAIVIGKAFGFMLFGNDGLITAGI